MLEVAQALPGPGSGRGAGRSQAMQAANLCARPGGRGDQPGPAEQTHRRQQPLERLLSGCSH